MRAELRFGERVDNPFGEGETTYWSHLDCGAWRRPEAFLDALAQTDQAIEDRDRLQTDAQASLDHHRLPRLAGAERDPSGRARCRNCREVIEKGSWRIVLQMWEDSRFTASGFVHLRCAVEYFGYANLEPRITKLSPSLTPTDRSEITRALTVTDADPDPR